MARLPWKPLLGIAAVVACAIAAVVFDARGWLEQVLAWIARLGWWGPAVFVALYVAATVMMLPGSVLTLGAGVAFGLLRGSIYASVGATLGAAAAFLVGRYLARDWVGRKVASSPRFAAIDRAVGREGWKIVFLTRLSPVIPFNLLNYAFGLTDVRFVHYLVASWIGMIPGTVMYVYLGSLINAAGGSDGVTTGEWILYGVGATATVAVTVVVTRVARRALASHADLPDGAPESHAAD